jgi:hypothetical protein
MRPPLGAGAGIFGVPGQEIPDLLTSSYLMPKIFSFCVTNAPAIGVKLNILDHNLLRSE